MRIASTEGATVLTHEGAEYVADSEGMFDVPESVGAMLTRFPHWRTDIEHRAALAAELDTRMHDPDVLVERVAALERQVAELLAKRGPGRPRSTG